MTLEEIARIAGVSRSTVSRVVNNDPRVSPGARARIEAVVRDRGYVPHSAARSLASRRTRIVGLLFPTAVAAIFGDPFFARLTEGAAAACNAADHQLMLLLDPGHDPAAADRLQQRVIRGRHLDGAIIASSVVEDPLFDRLDAAGFPYVLVGRHPHRRVNLVDVDNRAAARAAVAHLLGHGRRRIALVAGPPNMIASIDRAAGWADALAAAGIAPDPALVARADFTRRGGYRAMQRLLAAPEPPDAAFVASDTMASGALQALRDAGRRAPADVAVMGFDDLDESSVSLPILSTVAQPVAEMGRAAVGLLLAAIARPGRPPEERWFPTRLVLRRTCGCGGPGGDGAGPGRG